jgi:hypothetical protein
MVDACAAAWKTTGEPRWLELWAPQQRRFLGREHVVGGVAREA